MRSILVLLLFVPADAFSWNTYQSLLVSNPVLTKAVTSGVIMGLSDGLTQKLEAKLAQTTLKTQNWKRTWQTFCTGIVWSGPSAHYWYATLEAIMKEFFASVTHPLAALVLRLFLDALIFSPVTIAGFFTVNSVLQHGVSPRAARTVQEKMRAKWFKAVKAAWSFWPVVNIFNFWLVPLKFRVLYVNVLSLIWTGYLSFVNYQKTKEE